MTIGIGVFRNSLVPRNIPIYTLENEEAAALLNVRPLKRDSGVVNPKVNDTTRFEARAVPPYSSGCGRMKGTRLPQDIGSYCCFMGPRTSGRLEYTLSRLLEPS